MENDKKSTQFYRFIRSFLPLQLIFSHVKYNLVALIYWIFLFLIVSDQLGYAFGIPILFYSPEYLGEVSTASFIFLGFAFGGFIMAFNTYSYIKLGPKYPFLILTSQPFFKFCKNNATIPLIFIGFYLFKMAQFQRTEEFASIAEIVLFCISIIGGILLFLILSIVYFFPMSRRKGLNSPEIDDENDTQPIESIIHRKKTRWYHQFSSNKNKTYIYLGKGLKFMKSRSIHHIKPEVIEQVLSSNKFNTTLFELLTILSFVILGLFSSSKVFEMPAAMSIVLLLTMILMLFSALQSWFGKWTYALVIGVVIMMNYLSVHTSFFTFKNYAYGLNYASTTTPPYTVNQIEETAQSKKMHLKSYSSYLQTLENWKKNTGEERPKLVILMTSGGGSRSALWTFGVLQKIDEATKGKLQTSLHLITGASGGMIGASYFRELVLRYKKKTIPSIYKKEYRTNLGKDMLNKLSFSASTNDIFFRYQKISYNGYEYPKDRGYAFEEQLHENTDYFMNHALGYYSNFEKNGTIPTMIFSPTIVNDGRRLLISSQNLNFLTSEYSEKGKTEKSYENIDYQSFFSEVQPNDIRFSSVMRSSSTFPFVMPMMTMPSSPEIQLMDAGIRDNYGGKVTIEFLHILNDWISENTSGVIILQIRDTQKLLKDKTYKPVSFIDKLTMPFGNMYKNFPRTQDFDQEQLFNVGLKQFTFPVDFVTFNLRESEVDRISLSWHLSSQEKLKIENAFMSEQNQLSLKRFKALID